MPDAQTLLVLGATGDLCGRLLLPALARLHDGELLSDGFRFVGAGPQSWDRGTFQSHARTRLSEHAPDVDVSRREAFLRTVYYHPVDVLDPAAIAGLVDTWGTTGSVILYLALPTNLVAATVSALAESALPDTVRIAVEKPFGSDLPSARALNAALADVTRQDRIFRVDHILGMPTVQELPARLAPLLRPSAGPPPAVAEISILWEETLALEGRAAFYDQAGALKDLVQNHLLQILCVITMDPAPGPTDDDPSTRRMEALRRVQIPTADQAHSRRARYTAGVLASTGGAHGARVPDYAAEQGVDPSRHTETLAEVTLFVDAPQWSGVRFVLRAAKAQGARRRGICIRFRGQPSVLWIDVDRPAVAGDDPPATGFRAAPLEQMAYVNVLRNLLSGSRALSVGAQETELAWQIFTPILQAWSSGAVPLQEYPAGTTPDPGPARH